MSTMYDVAESLKDYLETNYYFGIWLNESGSNLSNHIMLFDSVEIPYDKQVLINCDNYEFEYETIDGNVKHITGTFGLYFSTKVEEDEIQSGINDLVSNCENILDDLSKLYDVKLVSGTPGILRDDDNYIVYVGYDISIDIRV